MRWRGKAPRADQGCRTGSGRRREDQGEVTAWRLGEENRQKAEFAGFWVLCMKLYLIASFIPTLPQAAEVSHGPPFTVEEAGKGGSGR